MSFKLKSGDICNLKQVIPNVEKKYEWKTGLYRVVMIHSPFGSHSYSYRFEKIKKNGTAYKNFSSGYTCLAWDKLIADGKVEII